MTNKDVNAHAISIDEVTKLLNTSLITGLSEQEAEKR